jgi:hypothetical protein
MAEAKKRAAVRYVDRDELKALWRVLERLQADVEPSDGGAIGAGYVWNQKERDALVTVMDAVKDSQTPPLFPSEG